MKSSFVLPLLVLGAAWSLRSGGCVQKAGSILRVLGFALALVAVRPAIVDGQTLSFLKTLPAGPPPRSAAAVAGDASGIYIAESDTFLRKYDRDGVEIWSRRLEAQIRSMTTHGAGVYVGGLTQYNTVPGPHGSASVESLIRLYDAQGNEIWTRQFGFTGEPFKRVYPRREHGRIAEAPRRPRKRAARTMENREGVRGTRTFSMLRQSDTAPSRA